MGTHTGRGSLSSVSMFASLQSESSDCKAAKRGRVSALRGDDPGPSPWISARSLRGRPQKDISRDLLPAKGL